MEYKTIELKNLKQFSRRDIRPDVIEKLKERINISGYNPARPITVVRQNGHYLVADGNHRLAVAEVLKINELPCVIREGNEYTLAIQCNQDEDTYAPEDLFDRLDTIRQLKEQGLIQAEIGEVIGISRKQIADYSNLINHVVPVVLNLCRNHQEGRGTLNVPSGTYFNFTEGWFRDSGLYDLCDEFQLRLINEFIADKCNWNKSKVQQTSAKYKLWQEMIIVVQNELQDKDKLEDLTQQIKNGVFQTIQQLRDKISELNKNAKNKLICGDCLIELEKLDDASIDIVITDPPYGIEYKSNFSKYNDNITKSGVKNDDENAVNIFEKTCEILQRKTKDNSHLYFFIDFKNFPLFSQIASKYFEIKTPIVWYKSDAGIGDLKMDWINGTEIIIYCTKGYKEVNKRRVNVLEYKRLHTSKMIHPTQKPEELITEILSVSANKYDVFCDPFMGSGSHIKAAKKYGCNYIGIELDREMFEKASLNINI
jgi:DNA modification methylase/transcriptional regulator with XRE-family HTH domain